jgi:hypothetical protein
MAVDAAATAEWREAGSPDVLASAEQDAGLRLPAAVVSAAAGQEASGAVVLAVSVAAAMQAVASAAVVTWVAAAMAVVDTANPELHKFSCNSPKMARLLRQPGHFKHLEKIINELSIHEPIRYGSWCGRDNFLSNQDIVTA